MIDLITYNGDPPRDPFTNARAAYKSAAGNGFVPFSYDDGKLAVACSAEMLESGIHGTFEDVAYAIESDPTMPFSLSLIGTLLMCIAEGFDFAKACPMFCEPQSRMKPAVVNAVTLTNKRITAQIVREAITNPNAKEKTLQEIAGAMLRERHHALAVRIGINTQK